MRRLCTDEYYHIGVAHLGSGMPCQDYALSGTYSDMAYAVVSDGCSNPKKNPNEPAHQVSRTDIGARILALATAKAVKEEYASSRVIDTGRMAETVAVRQDTLFRLMAETLDLKGRDLLATCLVACVTPKGGFAHIVGDGVIAFLREDGTIVARRYEWKNSLPAYPVYRANGFASFIHEHGGPEALSFFEEIWERKPNESWIRVHERTMSVELGVIGVIIPISETDCVSGLSCVALFSDGVVQVDGIEDWKEVVSQMLAFKTMEGEFVKRRTIKFIKRAQKLGKGPMDDLSSAVIRIVHDEASETEESG